MPADRDRRTRAKADFIRMVRWIAIIAVLFVIGALVWMSRHGPLEPATIAATIAGVFFSVLLGCGLFAAAFFSDKSGHDDAVGGGHVEDRDDQ